MIYKTSLDSLSKSITIVFTILFAYIVIRQYPIYKDTGNVLYIYTAVGLVLIYSITFAFRPINYQLTADSLIVPRLIKDVKIDHSEIKSSEIIDKSNIGWSIRTFGVGGVFGYYGTFLTKSLWTASP